ncbi:unnamed protein product [Tetraodon nigroviridis]|uniref:(spotted green pufferfish) hypothetical protein n=1 Tax=Tetraodon nigroviridis TaxID=99883 RepID=Q4RG24_TETNG|nr:unnamed protein product [Tetraodon nigroviridis]
MSDSDQQQAEKVSEWPENGGEWSDEDGENVDCGLLQAMAEEDEEINVHNEETFGMAGDSSCAPITDLDVHESPEHSGGLLCETAPAPPTTPPNPRPPLLPSSPSPPRPRPRFLPCAAAGQRGGGGRWQRRGLGRGQMFEDPAVMRMVQGRPSLKVSHTGILWGGWSRAGLICDLLTPAQGLDSAIVDCGKAVFWNSYEDDRETRRSQRILPQKAVQPQRAPPGPLHSMFVLQTSFNLVLSALPTTGSFMFPINPRCPSTPQSLTPKMMQLRFGANSPRPSPFYSPSSNSVQHFRKAEGWDPYCSLMTAKEKEWITRLQMIQLQSERPYLEDYYYQEYYRRIEAKMAEEELGIRGKREPPKLTTPYITKTDSYTPVVHIEGSLGQVAVSTCYSPRRAIGAVHAVQAQGPVEEQKDVRRQRLEVLSKIEKLFIVLLEVEEADRMKTTVLSEMEEKRLMEEKQKKVDHIYSQVQHHSPQDSGEEFLPFLLVAKGKRLIGRLLPFLTRDAAFNVLRVLTSNLPLLMSRDTEEALPLLYPPLRNVIGGLSFSQLISVLKDLSLTSNESLTLVCQNKFGLSLLYALLSQGEKLLSSGVPLEPSIGDFETWYADLWGASLFQRDDVCLAVFRTDSIFQVAGQLTQCSLVEPLLLPSNLLTLFCRYLDKRTVHQLKSNME